MPFNSGDVTGTVETILRSNVFFSPAAYRCRVKSPVEFAIGLARAFEARVGTGQLSQRLAGLGQNLLAGALVSSSPDLPSAPWSP